MMTPQRIRIPLSKLLSPKDSIDFRDRTGMSFDEMVQDIKSGKSIEPIEVSPVRDMYYIWNGVRRALAALKAGKSDIDAVVVLGAGKPMGTAYPLLRVRMP